ncbi:NK-tumor recognition protein [Camelus dromedarius]|uniref:NK-tumor recognition protein n=1 Tax=Camelus dromedarius TaxID=9838 RepID=A0A5N4CYI3_CAMDR|nr:NK-tumor recognition protein [Camelus dromedarius]
MDFSALNCCQTNFFLNLYCNRVHVVFGLVISGFEVIEQIENLKTDAASRPYADVRVIDCGVLATKSTKEESETEQERSRRRKHKRRPKVKRSKKRRKEASSSEEPRNKHIIMSPKGHSERSDTNEKRSVDSNAKREKPVVRPEEIPPVPENRFLLRRDMPLVTVEPEPKIPDVTPIVSDQKPSVSKSGRKIKGRGTIRYHTPPRSRSCSESDDDDSSETPPHWKEEMQRLRAYRPPSGEKWSKGDNKTKRKNYAGSKWDSESNSERDITKNSKNNARPSSDKEEGEATSDSESELGEIHIKAKPTTKSSANTSLPDSNGAWKSSRQRSSTSDSEGFCSNSESTRGKPHKHKHGSKETLKREHTKKAKEKLKGKKDKKHKAPKRKQAFHWQPPLEFGEEEEEEINEKQVTQEAKEKKQVSENSEAIKENILQTEKSCEDGSLSGKHNTVTVPPDIDQPTKEGSKLSNSPTALNAEENVVHSPLNIECVEESVPSGVEDVLQTDDNMEICTPDRSSPAKVEETSPPGNSRLDTPDRSIVLKQDMPTEHPEAEVGKQESSTSESKTVGKVGKQDGSSASSAFLAESTVKREVAEKSQTSLMDNKWKPLQGVGNLAAPTATTSSAAEVKALTAVPEMKPQGLRIEIKSKNKVRPGSLFDEVRKTARLNRRPRNQESSSDEQTPSRDGDSQSRSPSRSRSKSETKSRHRTRRVCNCLAWKNIGDQEATLEVGAEDGTAEAAQEAGAVPTAVTKVIGRPAGADPGAARTIPTVGPVFVVAVKAGPTLTIATPAGVGAEVEARGATVITEAGVTIGGPGVVDLMAPTVKVTEVTPITGAPVKAADIVECVPFFFFDTDSILFVNIW